MSAAQHLAAMIYDLRADMGASQRELARELGVSQSAVSRWEAGYCLPWRVYRFRLYKLAPGLEAEMEDAWRAARRELYHHPRQGG